MREPWTAARYVHESHVFYAEGCPYCQRRLEASADVTADRVMNYCTVHGEVNCTESDCFVCGNHQLDERGVCTDPKCRAGTRIEFLQDGATSTLPYRAYEGDAGLDLCAAEDVTVPCGEFRDVPIGLRMALPEGYFARITGRSSGFRRRGFIVIEGVIDAGYRGPLYAGVWVPHAEDRTQGLTLHSVTIKVGDKIAQMLIHRVERLDPRYVEELPASERGEKGFGSSGK